ncbi:hypothetical protein AGMMS49546_18220 [Spirochaetia bacterium]|nr:hypothetical protein AGMMS49546_18220 [Spirochaetia bacterium]
MEKNLTNSKKFSLMIVDDSGTDLTAMDAILNPDYQIYTADSGELALKLIPEKLPDLVLLDLIMPGMDGFQVLKKLKKNPNTRRIPVIFITGSDNEADEEQGFALGVVDYVRKPFNNELIKARIKTHIEILEQLRTNERLVLTDPLTGIANRRNFDERFMMEWRRAIRDKTTISFLMMDLDKFKSYNDTYGHPQGDALLKTAAKVFEGKMRRPGDFVARLGGEEFGIILPNTTLEAALTIAEEVRAGIETLYIPTFDESKITSTTISIGVVSKIPVKGDRIEDFITRADKNLYAAKDGGRNRVCHTN